MKSFKQFISDTESEKYEWCTIQVGEEIVYILFKTEESMTLNEAKNRGLPVGGQYSIQFHGSHSPVGMNHLHAYERNNQLFALNIDGTAHDRSHGVRIPNKLAKAITHYFPNFKIPQDNMIESAPISVDFIARQLLLL